MIILILLWEKLLNFGHEKLRKVMEKVLESHGIFKVSKSTNPDWWNCSVHWFGIIWHVLSQSDSRTCCLYIINEQIITLLKSFGKNVTIMDWKKLHNFDWEPTTCSCILIFFAFLIFHWDSFLLVDFGSYHHVLQLCFHSYVLSISLKDFQHLCRHILTILTECPKFAAKFPESCILIYIVNVCIIMFPWILKSTAWNHKFSCWFAHN